MVRMLEQVSQGHIYKFLFSLYAMFRLYFKDAVYYFFKVKSVCVYLVNSNLFQIIHSYIFIKNIFLLNIRRFYVYSRNRGLNTGWTLSNNSLAGKWRWNGLAHESKICPRRWIPYGSVLGARGWYNYERATKKRWTELASTGQSHPNRRIDL